MSYSRPSSKGDSLVYWTDGTGRPHRVGMVCYRAHPFYQVVSMILQSMLLSLAMLGQAHMTSMSSR